MNKFKLAVVFASAAVTAGCGDDTKDGGLCDQYCDVVMANCTDGNAQYADVAECKSYCGEASWPDGTSGTMSGNSLECRIYHGGDPASANPAMHCSHAGPEGDGVCGSADFRTDPPGSYASVDSMGMPAVSTALVPSAAKNAYNDAAPASAGFVNDFVATLTAYHIALDANLVSMGLAPCSMSATPNCVTQEYAAGASVASLVVPDQLVVNPARPAGFPNGRGLADPVMDVTLAVLLLKLDGGICGGVPCTAATLAGIPLNPPSNDATFLTTFPYLAPAKLP